MAFRIVRAEDEAALRSSLPKPYQSALNIGPRSGPFALIVFRGSRDEVVLSRPVIKAIAAAPRGVQLVAAGVNFTIEAREALAAAGAVIVALGEFRWTDASYAGIHSS